MPILRVTISNVLRINTKHSAIHYAEVVERYRWTFDSLVIKFVEWTRFIATDLLFLNNAWGMTMISYEGSVAVNFQTDLFWNGIQKILINFGKPRICGVPVHAPGGISNTR